MATSNELLNIIGTQTDKFIADSNAAAQATASGARSAAKLSEDAAKQLRLAAESQATIVREDLTAKQRVEQAARSIALRAGYDPTSGSGPMLDLIDKINNKGAAVTALTQRLREEKSIKVWESPIAWIQANYFSDTEEQAVLAAQELQAESGRLQALNNAVQQTTRTAEATAQTITEAKIVAAQQVAATDANLKAIQAEQEGIKYNVQAITAIAQASNETLGALHSLAGRTAAQENYQLQLAQEERYREQFEWQKEERKLQNELRNTQRSIDGYVLETINYGNKLLGRPDISGLDAKAMLELFKKGGSEELNKLYQIGMSYRVNPTQPRIGTNPAQAFDNLVELQGNVTEANKRTFEVLTAVRQQLPRTAYDPKTGKVDYKQYNAAVAAQVNADYAMIRPGSGNMFDVGDLASYVPGIQQLASLPLSQAIIDPAIKAGTKLYDPKVVIDLAIEGVKQGRVSMGDVVYGLSMIYSRANLINQAASGIPQFGIVPPNGGLNYNARVGFGTTIDLTDQVAIGRYISSQLGGMAYQQIRENRAKAFKTLPGSEQMR
jgi:hypothetical protein